MRTLSSIAQRGRSASIAAAPQATAAGALRRAGLDLRATRDVPVAPAEGPLQQAFLLAGGCVVEVVGPPAPDAPATQGAALWGLTLVAPDLDALKAELAAESAACAGLIEARLAAP